MGIVALDINATIDHVSKKDIVGPKTIWKLGIIDTRIRKQLEDIAWEYETDPSQPGTGKVKASFNIGKGEIEFVAFGLKGFENFTDKDGTPVEFKTEKRMMANKIYYVVSDEVIKVIPGDIITELANRIKEINKVGEEERKN
ncbi:MAG: hypothetical protein WCI77_08065 [Candidatus Omnitrophota bacterium]